MTPDAVQALARVALLELGPDEACAIAEALGPLVAQIAALPPAPAVARPASWSAGHAVVPGGQPPGASPGRPATRADVPGPALPVATALAGAAAVQGDLVVVPRFREDM